jgi:hypothetical protein
VRDALADRYAFEPRGAIAVKGKGELTAYYLLPAAPAASAGAA